MPMVKALFWYASCVVRVLFIVSTTSFCFIHG
jgi:hypothetical protein